MLRFFGHCPDDFEIIFDNTQIRPKGGHKHNQYFLLARL